MSKNVENKENVGNDTIHSVMPCLSNVREQYLEETKNDTKIKDLKPMFQNYQSIREKETLQFVEYATYHGINSDEMLGIKLIKEEAQHLLNCLIRTSAKGKDLDVGMKIERLLSIFVNKA